MEQLKPSRFFLDIFDGGHDLQYARAMDWFDHRLKADNNSKAGLTE